MGRRKIAIEPITHERNRSVTFLKRKHGLFKKAYELGVLCSVDVAVIIFEEKPGHHLKLYQYCSSDVHEMVQRHIRHDGEKDTRGPVDFSGVPNAKFEEFGDGDDDEVDDDDDPHRAVKRSSDGHIKSEDISLDVDLSYPQSHIFETPSYSNVPINSDRRLHQHHSSSLSNKRVRTGDLSGPGARSPRSNNSYISPTVATSQPFGRSQHADNSFFASPTSPQTFNTESSFDVTHPTRDQLIGARNGSSGTPSYPPRSTAYDAALYTPLIRHSSNNLGNGGSEGFKFLDGDSRSRAPATSGHLGTNLNWPDHGNAAYSSNPSAAGTNESTWLDFLNPGHGGHSGANPVVNASEVPGRRNSQTQSWERGPSSTRNSMSSPFTRGIPTAGDGSRRSRLTSSGSAGDDETSSGGNSIPSGIGNTGISIKKEKDIGG